MRRLEKEWDGLHRDFRRHQFFISRSERRQAKTRQVIMRAKKAEKKASEKEQRRRQDRSTSLQSAFRGGENKKEGEKVKAMSNEETKGQSHF